MSIDYQGRKDFSRPRKLVEKDVTLEQYQDRIEVNAFGAVDEREVAVDELFTDLAKTYLKGRVLQQGLSKMDPAQFIPIEEFADTARAAAKRLDMTASEDGEVITYSLYQKAVDKILAKKWELRGEVMAMKVPASVSQQSVECAHKVSGSENFGSLLKEFISQNGIISTIMGMLTLSPFQTVIFQPMTVEEGAKGVQVAQIPAGIALFLELGIKAERIISILRDSSLATPLVELQIAELSSSESARASALKTIGIDYDEFKKSQEFQDSEAIVSYVSEYYTRYGGLDRPGGHLTIDHWVAYLHVAQNQQMVRGALNTAQVYSPKFQTIKDQFTFTSEPKDNLFKDQGKKTSKIFIQLASATRALKESSNDLYDDIINTFNYQLTDRDLCCLVQIFGAIGNPDLMYTIASLLRILATNLSGELVRLQNLVAKFLANIAQDALFEIASQVNEFYEKVAHKITKAFTVDFDNLPACGGMFSLGWALMHSVRVIFIQINALLREISSIIGDFGLSAPGSWQVSADRRHLLGIARILEVLAGRLSLANTCERVSQAGNNVDQFSDPKSDIDQAIFSILGETPPNLVVSDEDVKKHFPNIRPTVSDNLKFTYGITSEQNPENKSRCDDPDQQAKIDQLIKNLTKSIQEVFNG